MGLSSALNAATSGLRASSRMVELTSSNVSNALTEGYARRRVETSSQVVGGTGGGTRISGVMRAEDVAATQARREVSTGSTATSTKAEAARRMAEILGVPGETGALAQRVASFDAALISARNDPASQSYLENTAMRGRELSNTLNTLSGEARVLRERADAAIAADVDLLNKSINRIHEINIEIRRRQGDGSEAASALEDVRQGLIDDIAEIVPVRVIKRQHGEIALFTQEGGTILDGTPRAFSFDRSPTISHDMTLAAGGLSGLKFDGRDMRVGPGGMYEGGRLGANFQVRDVDIPAFNAELDGFARSLVERFEDPAVDTTLAAGDAGLFTDNGAALDPANVVGLAGRLTLNGAVDPAQGGKSWRLRDGINATAEGDAGLATILGNLTDAFQARKAAPPGLEVAGNHSATEFAGEFTSRRASLAQHMQKEQAYQVGQLAVLRESESSRTGVDTDTEMANLLQFEQAYSANARVINVVDKLFQRLLEI